MQKVVTILEQHVQWIAIGLAVLFFGWVFYGNVITPPASEMAGGRTLTAGDVDQYVYDNSGQAMEQKVHSGGSLSVVVPDARQEIAVKLNPAPIGPIATMFTPKIFTPENPGETLRKINPRQANQPQITALPDLLEATPYGVSAGLSTMDLPPAPGQVSQGSVDQLWASAAFVIPVADIAKEFQAKQIPASFNKTEFLQVELVRQEQLPDGSWGNEKVIPPSPEATPVQPYPPVGQKGLEIPYKTWADTNQTLIIQPPFYTIKAGTLWVVPGTPLPSVATKPFNPATDIPKTDDEKKLKQQYLHDQFVKRQQEQKSKAASHSRPSYGGGRGGRGNGGAAGNGGDVANAPRPYYQVANPNYRGGLGVAANGGDENPDAAGNGGGGAFTPQPQGLPPEVQKMLGPVQGPFDPNTFSTQTTDKLLVWAHDLTVEPGKTYRYKVHYKMANPIFMAQGVAAAQKILDQFALISKDSKWTDTIKVPSQTEFYVHQGIAVSLQACVFDIYRWQNGQLQSKTMTVQVGDLIGGNDGAVDYSTGWTVVDLGNDVRTRAGYVILMDPKGNITRRDFAGDNSDPRYKELKEQYKALTQPANGQPVAGIGGR